MRIRDLFSAIMLTVILAGCDKVDYSRHFKHTDDPFYKGTYVVRETYVSIFNTEATDKPSLRTYKVLATDTVDQSKELSHSDLLKLRSQGYRIIIK